MAQQLRMFVVLAEEQNLVLCTRLAAHNSMYHLFQDI